MELPLEYKSKLESLLDGYSLSKLKDCAFSISEKYQSGVDNHISDILSARVYAVMRFPATFKAFSTALEYSLVHFNEDIKTMMDVGAGSGAATLAALEALSIDKVDLLEKEPSMIEIGKSLFAETEYFDKISYQQIDVATTPIEMNADLVVSSYVLNELDNRGRLNCLNKMWDMANKMIVIVEPGTPSGAALIKEVREYYISLGGFVLAPCPHMNECCYDWCHFSTRVMRSKLHKQLKGGDAPYEDEKFSYIAISKSKCELSSSRILRHPIINPGFVELEVCSANGVNKIKVTKKDKELFKKARKSSNGEEF